MDTNLLWFMNKRHIYYIYIYIIIYTYIYIYNLKYYENNTVIVIAVIQY